MPLARPLRRYKTYPRARFILTTREPLAWAAKRRRHKSTPATVQRPCGLKVEDFTLEANAALFQHHNDFVRCLVPADRLLAIDLEDVVNKRMTLGRLANFLSVALPPNVSSDDPFPRVANGLNWIFTKDTPGHWFPGKAKAQHGGGGGKHSPTASASQAASTAGAGRGAEDTTAATRDYTRDHDDASGSASNAGSALGVSTFKSTGGSDAGVNSGSTRASRTSAAARGGGGTCTKNQPLKYFVYNLTAKARECGKRGDCVSVDCAFGNSWNVEGVEVWDTAQHDLPWLVYRRFLQSPSRTLDPAEADVFLVPTWVRGHYANQGCCRDLQASSILPHLLAQNALLANDTFPFSVARRHIIMDTRAGGTLCSYMDHEEPAVDLAAKTRRPGSSAPAVMHRTGLYNYFARVSLEDVKWDKEKYNARGETTNVFLKQPNSFPAAPWHWYTLPYPSLYSGPPSQCPAVTRTHRRPYLWQLVAGGHGMAKGYRQALGVECQHSPRCTSMPVLKAESGLREKGCVTGADDLHTTSTGTGQRRICHPTAKGGAQLESLLAGTMLRATFCAEPVGDTLTRKGLIDAITMGCIPIVTWNVSRRSYMAHVSEDEFASMAIVITDKDVLPKGMPYYRRIFGEPPAGVQPFNASQTVVEDRLAALTPGDVAQLQANLARFAPRFIVSRTETAGDAVDRLVRRVVGDALVQVAMDTMRVPPGAVSFGRRSTESVRAELRQLMTKLGSSDINGAPASKQAVAAMLRRADCILPDP